MNLTPNNIENVQPININSPEWDIEVGNTQPEKIPAALLPPRPPKLQLPAHLRMAVAPAQAGGRRRRATRVTRATRRKSRKPAKATRRHTRK